MKKWRIENRTSGIVLGVYAGETEGEALDAMARDAGYNNYADALSVSYSEPDFIGTPEEDELFVEEA